MGVFNRVALAAVVMLGVAAPAKARDAAPAAPAPIKVMVVGTFHFANPGLDYRNLKVDDVLAAPRQKEIAAVAAKLASFRPTLIGVEWPDDAAAKAWAQYRAGTLAPSRDETVQLAFRTAKLAGMDNVRGLDMPMGLPFEPVFAFAAAHHRQDFVDKVTQMSEANVAAQDRTLKAHGIAATLRLLNDPIAAQSTHGLYLETLKMGEGADQPGLEATVAWYRRNLGICARLLQAAKPGDRVIVFFGGGHLTLLRQCVTDAPGYELVESLPHLPG